MANTVKGGFTAPPRIPKAAELIAQDIRRRIVRGELQDGDYLPLENVLKAAFGTSRPTLREAFRILESEKLISLVRGARTGARVHRPQAEAISQQAGLFLQSQATTVKDIYDARLAIEPFCARQLAAQRNLAAADALQQEADRLIALVHEARYIDFMIALADFHHLLVEQAENHTLTLVMTVLRDMTARYQVAYFQRNVLDEETQRARCLMGIRSFQRVIDLIRAGEAERAESHWRLHVHNANASWVPQSEEQSLLDMFE